MLINKIDNMILNYWGRDEGNKLHAYRFDFSSFNFIDFSIFITVLDMIQAPNLFFLKENKVIDKK